MPPAAIDDGDQLLVVDEVLDHEILLNELETLLAGDGEDAGWSRTVAPLLVLQLLAPDEVVELALLGDEFFVGAVFGDAAVLE